MYNYQGKTFELVLADIQVEMLKVALQNFDVALYIEHNKSNLDPANFDMLQGLNDMFINLSENNGEEGIHDFTA